MNAFRCSLSLLLALPALPLAADDFTDPPPPTITSATVSNAQRRVTVTPYPSADEFRMLRAGRLGEPWAEDTGGAFSGLLWTAPDSGSNGFYRLQVTPLSSNEVLAATVLNRLCYGPTPELIDHVRTMGVDAFIAGQLSPDTIVENVALTHTNVGFIAGRLGVPPNVVSWSRTSTGPGTASLHDLRAHHLLHAIGADRQLLEVLVQFFDNHFTTQAGKSVNYFTRFDYRDPELPRFGPEFEWREIYRWRQALLNPGCTFSNLLVISAESPAMIIYLDTVTSRGDGGRVPNENYSRELLELFSQGVDNGYSQVDIEAMAHCWAGWTLQIVETNQANNPFAPRATTLKLPTGGTAITNLLGIWAFNFQANRHGSQAKSIFTNRYVPARFGPPYTTKLYGGNTTPGLYQLNIPSRTGTNGIRDGYDVVAHLANLPFTQEFISVKLCRLFVHEGFEHGHYDYTDPGLSEEGKLVKACLQSWEATGGQLRPLLQTIFNSALFRGQGAYAHKVKTPLEYAASAVRALRVSTNGSGLMGTFTASSDGYGLILPPGGPNAQRSDQAPGSVLNLLGEMDLFNREEPDGWPEQGAGWIHNSALTERINFLNSLLTAVGQSGKTNGNVFFANNVTQPVRLLQLRLPLPADQVDAGQVADLFLSLLFPGEGRASLGEYRQAALDWLNTADDGLTPSPFSALSPSAAAGSPYDTRVRGMVAMLLSLDRFHEQ
jgi:uncharacterized protein (DUF1800 family)